MEMRSTTIPDLIKNLDCVDLIDMDIQGAELPCIERSIKVLTRKVRRLFISTHSDSIHTQIGDILKKAGWKKDTSYWPLREQDTSFGRFTFQDGVQYWTNPTFDTKSRNPLRQFLTYLTGHPS
ncbi:MAG: FkbM family methyltransferase [Rhizobiales bacterium]|nr:FkbM family methyltransferase [Hyphomicrobiales bacterium]